MNRTRLLIVSSAFFALGTVGVYAAVNDEPRNGPEAIGGSGIAVATRDEGVAVELPEYGPLEQVAQAESIVVANVVAGPYPEADVFENLPAGAPGRELPVDRYVLSIERVIKAGGGIEAGSRINFLVDPPTTSEAVALEVGSRYLVPINVGDDPGQGRVYRNVGIPLAYAIAAGGETFVLPRGGDVARASGGAKDGISARRVAQEGTPFSARYPRGSLAEVLAALRLSPTSP